MSDKPQDIVAKAEALWAEVYKQLPWEAEPPYGDRRPWWEVRDGLGSPFVELWDEPLAKLIALLPELMAEVKRLRETTVPKSPPVTWVNQNGEVIPAPKPPDNLSSLGRPVYLDDDSKPKFIRRGDDGE